jgi:putative ABC transport system permease protein
VGKSINLTSFPAGIIVGVVKDYNYSSLHSKIEPLIIGSTPYFDTWKKQLYVKISTAGIANTLKEIEAKWKLVSGENNLSFQFLDEHFREVYRSERQTANMVGIIGGLAIIIACLGLLGLITFVIIRRTKEISIRKVLGASVINIAAKLSNEFIRLVLIAFIIASPIAWYFMNKWLQDFAFRTTISWWVFAVAGISAVVIALITVSFQAIKVAMANPVKNLRAD